MYEICGKYQVIKEIGKGKFGIVYKGKTKKNDFIAIKFDYPNLGMLKHETTILNYLHQHGCKHIPLVYWFGISKEPLYQELDIQCLIIPFYECSLIDYMKFKEITIKQLNVIMYKILEILDNVHDKFVIHRDIKPDNLMVKNGHIFLIDFGLSTIFVDENKKHKKYQEIQNTILGTPKYISHNIHQGIEPSRRDDLISLGYMYINMFMGSLPWDNLYNNESICEIPILHINHPRNLERFNLKQWKNIEYTCKIINDGCIYNFMNELYNLGYDERPRYDFWKEQFLHS